MKGSLHGKRSKNTEISRLHFEAFSCHFVSVRVVMKNTFLGVKSTFTSVSRLPFELFSWNPYLAFYEDTLLKEQNIITAVYCISLQAFPEAQIIAL